MITLDFLSPGGAFTPAANGNTQDVTATFSITSGTNTLTCNSGSPFAAANGDAGKYFMLQGAGSSGLNSEWLFGTITASTTTTLTLSANATKTLSSASKNIIWGTDDSAALRAFNTYAQAQSDSVTLTFGAGAKNFIFASSDSSNPRRGGIAWNVPFPMTLQGNGGVNSTTKFYITPVFAAFNFMSPDYLKSGDGNYGGSSTFVARLDSAAAGSTTLQCKTIADAALFTSGTWALMTGLDLQGTGQPPNPFYYEYVYMTNVNTGTGAITLQSPLQNSYLDTWPHYTDGIAGSEPDHGGPATLYVLDTGWGSELTVQGIHFKTEPVFGQMTTKGKKLVFRDVKYTDSAGLIPSGSREVEFYDCDLTSYQMEIDKITESVIFDNTDTAQLRFQSSVNRVVFRNGSTTTSGGFNGTPRYLSIVDSTAGDMLVGATSFGRDDLFETSGSTFTGTFDYRGIIDNGDLTAVLQNDYSMSDSGVITIPRAGHLTGPAVRLTVPGTKCYFTGTNPLNFAQIVNWGHTFTIRSVTADATNVYIQTDWPFSGGFRTWMSKIIVQGTLSATAAASTTTSNTAIQNIIAATAAGYTSVGHYSFATLNGATCGTDVGSASIAVTPPTGGKLVSLKVNVTTPYTGVQSTLDWGKATQFVLSNDASSFLTWNPRFDLKTAGLRTITPSGVTGAAGADSLSAPPANAWLSHWLESMSTGSRNIVAEYNGNPSVGPVFTVELIVNPVLSGVAPLRLRLHA